MSGQGDDRDALRGGVRLQAAGGGPTVQAGQSNIHQNQIGQFSVGQGQSLLGVLGREDFMAPGFEPAGEQHPIVFVVFDHKNLRHKRGRRAVTWNYMRRQ